MNVRIKIWKNTVGESYANVDVDSSLNSAQLQAVMFRVEKYGCTYFGLSSGNMIDGTFRRCACGVVSRKSYLACAFCETLRGLEQVALRVGGEADIQQYYYDADNLEWAMQVAESMSQRYAEVAARHKAALLDGTSSRAGELLNFVVEHK